MTPITDVCRAYRPLNGEDAIEVILLEFRTALRNSGMFPLHRVWHEFEFQGGVRVKGWATKTEEVKFAGGGEVGEAPAEGSELVDGKVAASLRDEPPSVTRERIVVDQEKLAQDAARYENAEFPKRPLEADTLHVSLIVDDPTRAEAISVSANLEPIAAIIDSGFDEAPRVETDRHVATDQRTPAMVFECAKCGRPSRTNAGKSAHERHCKGSPDVTSESLSTPA